MTPIPELYANNRSVYEFFILLLTHARSCNRFYTIRRFLDRLLDECRDQGIDKIDLNNVFRFVLFHAHLLVTMRSGGNDLLVLRRFENLFRLDAERIEFTDGDKKDDSQVFISEKLKFFGKDCFD